MTMLDRMRRHKNWLKWSLILVCLAFRSLLLHSGFSGHPRSARSDGNAIHSLSSRAARYSGSEFLRTYQAQLQAYRTAYGSNMNDQLLRQLGVDQQVLQQMVDERAALAEAARLDIRVTDAEVRQRILTLPAFQEKGSFIGEERLRAVARSSATADGSGPVRRGDPERAHGGQAANGLDRVAVGHRSGTGAGGTRRRNEKVKLAVVSFPIERFRTDVSATDSEVTSYFDAHSAEFQIPEKREDPIRLRRRRRAPREGHGAAGGRRARVQRRLRAILDPRRVASEPHPVAIRRQGRGRGQSQGRGGAETGPVGLRLRRACKKSTPKTMRRRSWAEICDFFGRGRMVPEFDEAAFALEAGQAVAISVRTPFGFHIIKVIEKKGGATRSLTTKSGRRLPSSWPWRERRTRRSTSRSFWRPR